MAANELFRFRTVRAVQNKQVGFSALQTVTPAKTPTLDTKARWKGGVKTFLGTLSWVQTFSEQLALSADQVSPAAIPAMLPGDWVKQVGNAGSFVQDITDILAELFQAAWTTKADAKNYNIPVIPLSATQPIELAIRLLLVMDLLTTLTNDQTAAPASRQLQSGNDVKRALAFRSLVLPSNLFDKPPTPVLARAPGVTDLSVVKEEWNRYIAGELANVVNVLPGETFESSSGHLEKTVTVQSTTSVQSTTQTTENSQTSSSTLSATATADASLNIGAHGQVETTGQYGPTKVQTNIGAQLQFSQSSSQTSSHTTAMETVSRAVKTVTQTITQVNSTSTTVEDRTRQGHKLQNTPGSDVVVGLYRWLSIVHRVQLVSYPNRLVVEFEIPEPGAWLKWALTNQPDQTPWDNPDPGPFAINNKDNTLDPTDPRNPDPKPTAIQPNGLTPAIASALASRWRIQGLTVTPSAQVVIGYSYNLSSQNNNLPTLADNTMSVPPGYQADTWSGTVVTYRNAHDNDPHFTEVYVSVGGDLSGPTRDNPADSTVPPDTATAWIIANSIQGKVGSINTGTIPVTIFGHYVTDVNVTINVNCIPIPAQNAGTLGTPYIQWQLATFNQIASAYNDLRSAHNQERDARAQESTGPLIIGPPALNLSRSVAELKRLAIQNLLGQPFWGYDLLQPAPLGANLPPAATQEPSVNPPDEAGPSPVIQFFEQAFEWENIVYINYPYFWGGRDRWLQDATAASADPVFDQFLNAGSVRLVVPARPGFENLVNFFLYTSMVWSGQNPPGPNDPGYLSVADEIQSIQVGATDGTPIDPPWEVVLPTTLLWAGTVEATLPVNPNATIGPPPEDDTAVSVSATSSQPAAVFGQALTFSVSVTAANAVAGEPTGQVSVVVDGVRTPDSPVTLDGSGNAKCAPIATLAAGPHSIVVTYLGDKNFGRAMFTLAQHVAQASSSTAITSSQNPSAKNAAVALSAAVTAAAPGTGTPTGKIALQVDGTATPDSPLVLDGRGKATFAALAGLGTGDHSMTVSYAGDANFAASSANLKQTVNA